MPDRFGPRGVIALMIPLQNSNMQPEYEAMRPDGVSNQCYRFTLTKPDKVHDAVIDALPGAMGCHPDLVVTGNSMEMRYWSVERQAWYREQHKLALPDVPVITATDSTVAGLRTVGARKIAMLTPMVELFAESARDYYDAMGFDVLRHDFLKVEKPEDIINLPVEKVHEAFDGLDGPDVDCFLHAGGALGIVDYLDDLEEKLGRPVISVNAVTYWYALRKLGVTDPLSRGGRITRMALPEEFA